MLSAARPPHLNRRADKKKSTRGLTARRRLRGAELFRISGRLRRLRPDKGPPSYILAYTASTSTTDGEQPDCATAFYGRPGARRNNSSRSRTRSAARATRDGGQEHILGTSSMIPRLTATSTQFTGVPRASVYSIIKLGPCYDGYYEYVKPSAARSTTTKYDDEVRDFSRRVVTRACY